MVQASATGLGIGTVNDTGNPSSNTYTSAQIYTFSTTITGFYAVAHIVNQPLIAGPLSISFSVTGGTPNMHAVCAEISGLTSCASGGCIDSNGPKGSGCASAASCGSASAGSGAGTAFTAIQNDEIIFSMNGAQASVTANSQTSADTGVCTTSAGSCSGNKWGAGSVSTARDSAYYRNITGGGSQTCNWTWTTNAVDGVSCIGLKSAVTATTCTLGLLGVGPCDDDAIEENN